MWLKLRAFFFGAEYRLASQIPLWTCNACVNYWMWNRCSFFENGLFLLCVKGRMDASTLDSCHISGKSVTVLSFILCILWILRMAKQIRTLEERLHIIDEVERNPYEKKINIAKRLGIPPSTLNSIISKKKEIREKTDKYGTSAKKRKTYKMST